MPLVGFEIRLESISGTEQQWMYTGSMFQSGMVQGKHAYFGYLTCLWPYGKYHHIASHHMELRP